MFAYANKRKRDAECRVFNTIWTTKYLFTEVMGKALCLVCGEHIAVFKEYKLNRHYQRKHAETYKNLTKAERARTSDALLAKLQKQTGFFTKPHGSRDAATRTSFVLSHKIAKNSKPFSEGGFVKECLVDSAALICPEKKEAFEQVPLSRRTVTRRIEDIAGNLKLQLQRKVASFDFFSLALDKSCDGQDTAQLLVFVRGITGFKITEELAAVRPMHGTETGIDHGHSRSEVGQTGRCHNRRLSKSDGGRCWTVETYARQSN